MSLGTSRFSWLALPVFLPLGLLISVEAPYFLLFIVAGIWSIFWLPGFPVGPFMTAKEFFAVGYLASTILHSSLKKNALFNQMFKVPTTWLLVLYVTGSLPGVLLSPAPTTSVTWWARLVASVLIYGTLLYHFVLKPGLIQQVLLIILGSLLPSILLVLIFHLGIFQPFVPPAQFPVRNPVAVGLSPTELELSWSVAYVLPVAIAYWLNTWRNGKSTTWLWAVLSTSLVVTCFLTHGRGGIVAAGLGAMTTMVLMRKNAKGIIALILLAVLLTVLLNATYFTNVLLHTKETGYTPDQLLGQQPYVPFLDIITSGRTKLYQAGIHAFSRAPITGTGLGMFGKQVLVPLGMPDSGAHNLYLSTAIESGIFALLAICITMIYILARYFRLSVKLADESNGFLAAAAYGIVIGSLFNTLIEYGVMFTSLYSGIPFWIALAVIDGLYLTSSGQEKSAAQQISLRTESVSVNRLADSFLVQD